MNTAVADVTTRRNIETPCPTSRDPRKIAQEYFVETQWVHIVPSTGIVVASCESYTVTFDCKQERSDWCNAMQNVLVGLGCYRTTSSVPDKLTDITSSPEIRYIIEWEKGADGITPIKTRPAIHRLAD